MGKLYKTKRRRLINLIKDKLEYQLSNPEILAQQIVDTVIERILMLEPITSREGLAQEITAALKVQTRAKTKSATTWKYVPLAKRQLRDSEDV